MIDPVGGDANERAIGAGGTAVVVPDHRLARDIHRLRDRVVGAERVWVRVLRNKRVAGVAGRGQYVGVVVAVVVPLLEQVIEVLVGPDMTIRDTEATDREARPRICGAEQGVIEWVRVLCDKRVAGLLLLLLDRLVVVDVLLEVQPEGRNIRLGPGVGGSQRDLPRPGDLADVEHDRLDVAVCGTVVLELQLIVRADHAVDRLELAVVVHRHRGPVRGRVVERVGLGRADRRDAGGVAGEVIVSTRVSQAEGQVAGIVGEVASGGLDVDNVGIHRRCPGPVRVRGFIDRRGHDPGQCRRTDQLEVGAR